MEVIAHTPTTTKRTFHNDDVTAMRKRVPLTHSTSGGVGGQLGVAVSPAYQRWVRPASWGDSPKVVWCELEGRLTLTLSRERERENSAERYIKKKSSMQNKRCATKYMKTVNIENINLLKRWLL